MKIGLIDIDGKIPNLALMKISTFYKSQGASVDFVNGSNHYDHIYASAILTKSKERCDQLQKVYGDRITIGGTGTDNKLRLLAEIESCMVDYDLYTVEMKVDPYVMRYNDLPDERLKHFERWVNSRIYKSCSFEEYEPWIKSKFQLQLL